MSHPERQLQSITPLELAFVVDDPCGVEHIELARAALQLISNRESEAECKAITQALRDLAKMFPRRYEPPTPMSVRELLNSLAQTVGRTLETIARRVNDPRVRGMLTVIVSEEPEGFGKVVAFNGPIAPLELVDHALESLVYIRQRNEKPQMMGDPS